MSFGVPPYYLLGINKGKTQVMLRGATKREIRGRRLGIFREETQSAVEGVK